MDLWRLGAGRGGPGRCAGGAGAMRASASMAGV